MRLKHEDFTFYDDQQTSQRVPLGDEREAWPAHRARREGAAREAGPQRSMFVWIREGIQALLSPHRLL